MENTEKFRTVDVDDGNIDALRRAFGCGLHWVVGDTHGETDTLKALMEKIRFDPERDHVTFVGDYNAGGDPAGLLAYIGRYYKEDHGAPGFHLIRGNHERELGPYYPLRNMPDIFVIRGNRLLFVIAHAGMLGAALDLISRDAAESPEQRYFAYRLTDACAGYDAPLRQIIWSRRGLYTQRSRWKNWPSEDALCRSRACVIHGHTPYCYFDPRRFAFYGDVPLYWKNQHVWFAEDLQAFDIDANIKGKHSFPHAARALSCVCLEAIDSLAADEAPRLTVSALSQADNFVFSEPYRRIARLDPAAPPDSLLSAAPEMKEFLLDGAGGICLR